MPDAEPCPLPGAAKPFDKPAARSLLKWSQADLAKAAGMGHATVARFERGDSKPYADTVNAIRAALEAAGIFFIEADETMGPGLRLRAPRKKEGLLEGGKA